MDDKYLARQDAPIGSETWSAMDSTMVEAAKSVLSARRILHIDGPFGLGLKAIPLQDKEEGGIITSSFVPLALIHRTFTLSKRDLAAYERDGLPANLQAVALAAIEVAKAEDNIIFNDLPGAPGLMNAPGSGAFGLSSWDDVGMAAEDIINAVTLLDQAGFHGPYTMALSSRLYNSLLRRYPTGGTELEHVKEIVTDGVYKAPAINSGGVIMASGRQFASIVIGQDMTLGFVGPRDDLLEFTISESLSPLIREPGAICVLSE